MEERTLTTTRAKSSGGTDGRYLRSMTEGASPFLEEVCKRKEIEERERERKKEKKEKKIRREREERLDLSEGDVMCDNTDQHSLKRPFMRRSTYEYIRAVSY